MYRAMPELAGWTLTDHLLASVIDAVHQTSHSALIGPHVDPKKLRKLKPPTPVQRPAAHRRKRRATSDDLKQLAGAAAVYAPEED